MVPPRPRARTLAAGAIALACVAAVVVLVVTSGGGRGAEGHAVARVRVALRPAARPERALEVAQRQVAPGEQRANGRERAAAGPRRQAEL